MTHLHGPSVPINRDRSEGSSCLSSEGGQRLFRPGFPLTQEGFEHALLSC